MERRSRTPGTVYLVGAGPGDPDLITVRGQRLLRRADVVVYDRLVHADLLQEARANGELYYVGKAPGEHKVSQTEINAFLTAKARRGNMVVRLKGGDPFVFGRGGEEAWHLHSVGVDYEVVPGITSATGVPAYAGIPVTHRGRSRAFTVVTGHTCAMDDTNLDWDHLTSVDTLVILMGLGRLPTIADRLIDAGRAPETPVAVIESGTTANQTVVRGALDTIEDHLGPLQPPATTVVGETAGWGGSLEWFEGELTADDRFPLEGRVEAVPEKSSPRRSPRPSRLVTA